MSLVTKVLSRIVAGVSSNLFSNIFKKETSDRVQGLTIITLGLVSLATILAWITFQAFSAGQIIAASFLGGFAVFCVIAFLLLAYVLWRPRKQ